MKIRRIYETVVLPVLTYASSIYWHKVDSNWNSFDKLHRLACMLITGCSKFCGTLPVAVGAGIIHPGESVKYTGKRALQEFESKGKLRQDVIRLSRTGRLNYDRVEEGVYHNTEWKWKGEPSYECRIQSRKK